MAINGSQLFTIFFYCSDQFSILYTVGLTFPKSYGHLSAAPNTVNGQVGPFIRQVKKMLYKNNNFDCTAGGPLDLGSPPLPDQIFPCQVNCRRRCGGLRRCGGPGRRCGGLGVVSLSLHLGRPVRVRISTRGLPTLWFEGRQITL